MKKIGIRAFKVIVFIIGFCLIFIGLQEVLHYHWVEKEDLYSTNIMLKTYPSDSYDVLFFGTSELKTAAFPAEIYHETGVTSFNYAVTNKSAMVMYYQLKYALRYQNPKVVCCDFSALYEDCLPSERETIYRKTVDTMPDFDLKWEMITSIVKLEPEQSKLSYLFPMLRYHSIWNELTEVNFQKDYVYIEGNPGYENGCVLSSEEYNGDPYDFVPEIWEVDSSDEQISEISMEWYDKFIELCHENEVIVVALFPPAPGFAYDQVARWNTTTAYLNEKGVEIIDYNNYEAVQRLGLRIDEDYLDNSHMAYRGSLKVSKDLAHVLADRYALSDHRPDNDTGNEKWNRYWNEFCEDYDVPDGF